MITEFLEHLGDLRLADARLAWVLVPAMGLWTAWVAWRWTRSRQPGRDRGLLFSNVGSLQGIGGGARIWLRRASQALRWITLILLLLAVLRPQTGRRLTQVQTEGIDIVLVLDTSGSMQALDLDTDEPNEARRRNRLEVSRDVIKRFVAARPGDQLGLVVFGEQAFTQCPLTLDHGVLRTLLDRVEIGIAGDATAIGSAVGVAVKRLQDSPAQSKVIVLLTDGRSNAGVISPETAAELAATVGVKIYTIGAGTRGEAPFLVETPIGPRLVYENVEIDEEMLQGLADATGGAYFRAEDEEALLQIYDQIDELEKTEITTDSYTEYDERFRWLVVPAIALLLIEVVLLLGPLRKVS